MRKYLTPFFSALPSVLIGTLIMSQYGVLINVYAQNIICLVICSLLSILYLSKKFNLEQKWLYIIIGFNIFLLRWIFTLQPLDYLIFQQNKNC